ncbi:RCC1 domain-containing protein [Oligoflexus tunisiensis]|uniref:RCC1 domain-containing protein n=1 Tax=Oligoflexus tunisiensis TaxID=708132 RepID=UPI000B02187C|nr:hypothetical protein [Oligoflexus tunisiensis]
MRLFPSLVLLSLLLACRSTDKPNSTLNDYVSDAASGKVMPLALGANYACVLNRKGQGLCLGAEAPVQNNTPARWQTLRAAGKIPVLRDLVARSTVTCGIGVRPSSLENRVLCWQPQTTQAPEQIDQDAVLLSGKIRSRLRSLSLQKDKVCGLLSDGQIVCGVLSATSRALNLTPVKGLRSMESLRSGEGFSCGLREDTGAIFCWGDNSQGQLGLGSALQEEEEPVAIAGFSGRATFLETGAHHACAINHAGEVLCWGSNSHQQLGVEGKRFMEPKVVRGLPDKATALALGARHSCAQLVNGTVWCWGDAPALGSETQGGLIPLRVRLPVASAHIVASLERTCSRLSTGEFFCWGTEPEVFPVPM